MEQTALAGRTIWVPGGTSHNKHNLYALKVQDVYNPTLGRNIAYMFSIALFGENQPAALA